jgi:F-type H+-transporting ATPase subunit delta
LQDPVRRTSKRPTITSRTAAERYARALFDVALKEQVDLSQIERELAAFTQLFAEQPSLERVLLNPAVPAPRKRAAMVDISRSAGATPIVGKLLVLLAERDRLALLPGVLAAYREKVLDHQKVVRAEVTTAQPLAAHQSEAIERRLAGLTGRSVSLSTRVDPTLIGGLVARVGSIVYDGSVATQLGKMKQRLTERETSG